MDTHMLHSWKVYLDTDAEPVGSILAKTAGMALSYARRLYPGRAIRLVCETAEPLYMCCTCQVVVTSDSEHYPQCDQCAKEDRS